MNFSNNHFEKYKNKDYLTRLFFYFSIIVLIITITCVIIFSGCGGGPSVHWYQVTDDEADGFIAVTPESGIAGELGTWTVIYKAGTAGIATGGGIRIQLPDTWHAGLRNSANRLQATEPQNIHCISSHCSNPNVKLETIVEGQSDMKLVKTRRIGLDNRNERYVYVVRVTIVQGRLKEGDQISIIYGDTSQGSPGMLASVIRTEPEPILSSIDTKGQGKFKPGSMDQKRNKSRPMIQSISGPPVELLVNGPSTLVVGQTAQLHIAIVDRLANPVMSFDKPLMLKTFGPDVTIATKTKILPSDGWTGGGWTIVEFTPNEPGVLSITVETEGMFSSSNPMIVYEEKPRLSIYWGDLHSHTKFSWDGVGNGSFDYARYVSGLDFYAMADHNIASVPDSIPKGLSNYNWDEYNALTDQKYVPGNFVTLHAYECSFGEPYGHHNVYFRGKSGALMNPQTCNLSQLWEALVPGQALAFPHHTGKFPVGIKWKPHDEIFRRNIEIYSGHGLSEAYNPDHPLSFENSVFTKQSKSAPASQTVQAAWLEGLHLSTIASSDEHNSHPGQPHYGIVAVMAPELTREAIFDALYSRRTYGTTGARIILDFSINGTAMGGETTCKGTPQILIHAIGTNTIKEIDLLRGTINSCFSVIKRWTPLSKEAKVKFEDLNIKDDAIYYVRLMQSGKIRGLPPMAWSSPIWVHYVQKL